MLEKSFRPQKVEKKHYEAWEKSGSFSSGIKPTAEPYTIVIPPPNVTGSLHMGHALNSTLQDILIRYQRMKGNDVLWQPGTDHAGIATQMVVERQMAEEGKTRHDLGRKKFIDRVWDWKAESGGNITRQLRRLGASCDWSRERFTMDDGLSRAVRKVFVELHKERLIYRDKRLVNWDPKLHTAISDLEVEQRETIGKLWYFKYPIEDREGEYITIATTRPETMLGDVAVAVHPDDNRYKNLVGQNCILPIVGRKLPIIADEYADPDKGSGAVKMTPAHDFNDFEVGRRNNLKLINVFDGDARLNENVPKIYQGLDRFDAREKVLAEIESLGLLEKVEDNEMTIPYGDRSGVVIEPWLMDQWFVDAERLAGPAITAVEQGHTKFVPKQWENTYYEWMRNIQPWCISRQIWWGHQIPAWFGPDSDIFVAETEEEAQVMADEAYGKPVQLVQDEDVLDTWFSSALWPFSTLGWPDETSLMNRHYPTDVLITGFDIIFFWVARMMMMGLHFLDQVPFNTVYIHALVRDEQGQKMSKSKGNVMDPLELVDKYGADSLRFTLTALAAQGRDVKMSESRVEGYRNFSTKLWNAARFCEMNGCHPVENFDPTSINETVNRWIIGKLRDAEINTSKAIRSYRFNDIAGTLYHFTWGTFCDWYVELIKPILNGSDELARVETRATAAWVLDQILHMLHPIMPFVTEELWQQLSDKRDGPLITSTWPVLDETLSDTDIDIEMDWVIRLISQVRTMRSEMNVPAKAKIPLLIKDAGDRTQSFMKHHDELIIRLARLESLNQLEGTMPKGALQDVIDEATIILPITDVVDVKKEKSRLEKEITKLESDVNRFEDKLGNKNFIANAPSAVVQTEKQRLSDTCLARDKMKEALKRLMSVE
jgi:valyl-tRNA synthetase